MSRPVRVAIVGAGLGGIAAAVRLQRSGITSFTVFEKAGGPGGVWWQNTYPGCEVDVPSAAYSFSFIRYDWSGTHAKQAELQRYCEDVIDRYGIRSHFRFDTPVDGARWDETDRCWTVRLGTGEDVRFEVIVSAVGMLSDPRLPTWPGLESFEGPVFHTSRFDHDLDLLGKRVALVGTGSSACQLGPAIAPVVEHLDVYQREPGHVLPKRATEYDDAERARLRRWSRWWLHRMKTYRFVARTNTVVRLDAKEHARAEAAFSRYLTEVVEDSGTREALRPGYPFGCKRPVFAAGWYPMFNRDNVTLVPHAVTEVAPDGVLDDTGTKRPADVLILSTGFRTTDYLGTMRITGPGGADLHESWDGEPWAFLGLTVPGFPNLFLLYGPNTNGGASVTAQLEIQAAAITRAVRRLRPGRALDTREGLARRVDALVQWRIGVTMSSLTSGCRNYYHVASGKNVTQWPFSHATYRVLIRLLSRVVLTRSGRNGPPRPPTAAGSPPRPAGSAGRSGPASRPS